MNPGLTTTTTTTTSLDPPDTTTTQLMYGRGRRSRNAAKRIDYKRLAGESGHFSHLMDDYNNNTTTNTNGNVVTTDATTSSSSLPPSSSSSSPSHQDATNYANKHIHHVISRPFDDPSTILQTLDDGSLLTSHNLIDPSHFLTIDKPILIRDAPESIGMRIPRRRSSSSRTTPTTTTGGGGGASSASRTVTIRDLGELIGMSHPVTVMDVRLQEELEGWSMGDLVDYFEDDDRIYQWRKAERNDVEVGHVHANSGGSGGGGSSGRVLNQISLEFSHTALRREVSSPLFVRELDWIDGAWPRERKEVGDFPRVQYYCLTSTAGCYTDFHVDFGGTSVWYHVMSGRKVFLLMPPTTSNLALYEKWLCSKDQGHIFFCDMTDGDQKVETCVKVALEENQTLMIPTGWIHAVYTPVDTLVLGGNFLHGLDINGQLNIHCLETRTRVPAKFRFPGFVRIMFYAGAFYLKKMRQVRNKTAKISHAEVDGLQKLIESLRAWSVQPGGDNEKVGSVAHTIRECVNQFHDIRDVDQFCNELERELDRVRKTIKFSIKLTKTSAKGSCTTTLPDKTKPKLKLKLTDVTNSDTKDKPTTTTPTTTTIETPKPTEEQDANPFQINIPSAYTIKLNVKRNKKFTDITSYRDENGNDGDDAEWEPETTTKKKTSGKQQQQRRRQRSSSLKKQKTKATPDIELSIDAGFIIDPSTSNVDDDDDDDIGKPSKTAVRRKSVPQTKKKVPSKRASLTMIPPKKTSARDRLKKKLKF